MQRNLSLLAAAMLVGACSSGGATPGASTAGQQSATPATVQPTLTPTPSPGPLPVTVTTDVAYDTTDPVMAPALLDVYAPSTGGPWPAAVMFHGGVFGDKADIAVLAKRVATHGFVVFAPTWSHTRSDDPSDLLTAKGLAASTAQVACGIAFAASNAAGYGGDASTLIVFGHSAGAMVATNATFTAAAPSVGCPGGATMPAVAALVTYEGDWLLQIDDPMWDTLLATDPDLAAGFMAWSSLPKRPDLKVVMLVSDQPEMPNLPVAKLAVRDPTGVLRARLTASGALADNVITWTEGQELLFDVLQAQGNPVTLDVMPASSHAEQSPNGLKVFVAAFDKAAARS